MSSSWTKFSSLSDFCRLSELVRVHWSQILETGRTMVEFLSEHAWHLTENVKEWGWSKWYPQKLHRFCLRTINVFPSIYCLFRLLFLFIDLQTRKLSRLVKTEIMLRMR